MCSDELEIELDENVEEIAQEVERGGDIAHTGVLKRDLICQKLNEICIKPTYDFACNKCKYIT